MLAHRRAALGVSLALASCLLAGCAVSPATVSRALADQDQGQDSSLSFTYTSESGGDYIDQVVQIDNESDQAQVPVLKFVALDRNGTPLPNVKVFTAFGSDHGNLVVPPGGAWEVLEFLGEGRAGVADVKVTVVKSESTYYPYVANEPEADVVDGKGHVIPYSDDFRSVRVTNDNDLPVEVRLAYVVWDEDSGSSPQQFKVSVPIGELITVPAHGDTVAQVDPAAVSTILRYGADWPSTVIAYYSR